MDRPWAAGLARLLAERRLKKQDLAALSPGRVKGKPMRAGNISAILNSPRQPDIGTLQRLAVGLTRFDRGDFKRDDFKSYTHPARPDAPAVGLWEFFVNDEQAALLRASASKQKELVSQDQLIDRVMTRLAPMVSAALKHEIDTPATQAKQHATAHQQKKHA